MAVKIERKGDEIRSKTTCRGCGAELSYTNADVKVRSRYGYDGEIECPGCGCGLIVNMRTPEVKP